MKLEMKHPKALLNEEEVAFRADFGETNYEKEVEDTNAAAKWYKAEEQEDDNDETLYLTQSGTGKSYWVMQSFFLTFK